METCCNTEICQSLNNCHYLNWRNPKVTGSILGLINIFFLTLWISEMNLIVFFTYLSLFYIIAGIIIAQFMEKPEKDDNEYEHVSKDTFEKILKGYYEIAFSLDNFFRRVTSLDDVSLTVKFFVGLYALITVSAWFSEAFLIWLSINLLFAWKPIVNTQGEQIEKVTTLVKTTVGSVISKIDAMIPKYKEEVKRN